ncbi:MAG: hypothetical protein IJ301_02135 [Clostridia bacterium]|nr:hypothetical protein [Clostridia bacterium]
MLNKLKVIVSAVYLIAYAICLICVPTSAIMIICKLCKATSLAWISCCVPIIIAIALSPILYIAKTIIDK